MNKSLVIFFILLIASCAIETSPTGGEKDMIPPQVIKSIPENKSVGFNENKITLNFDEYFELKNFNQQFSISPPLKEQIDYTVKGKSLILEWNDTLMPNTTYTLSFGNSIVDISEGNPQNDFKYVFSTGESLDSNYIRGNVFGALSGKPSTSFRVMLYPEESDDSAAFNSNPLYYGTTSENGSFEIENLAPGKYRLVAFEDLDFNFKISSRKEKVGFLADLIDVEEEIEYEIRTFKAKEEFEFYSAKHVDFGHLALYFSNSLPINHNWEILNEPSDFLWIPDENNDTLDFWFVPDDRDSIVFLSKTENRADTIVVDLYEKDSTKFSFSSVKSSVSPSEHPILLSSHPLKNFNDDLLIWTDNEDTVETPEIKRTESPFEIEIDYQPTYGHFYKAHLAEGFATDFFGDVIDSMNLAFSTKQEKEYSNLILKLRFSESFPAIVQILKEDGSLLREDVIAETGKLEYLNIDPGKFVVRIIYDENENGLWDTGDLLKKKQPEHVIYYQEELDLRANWEIEIDWTITRPEE